MEACTFVPSFSNATPMKADNPIPADITLVPITDETCAEVMLRMDFNVFDATPMSSP